MRQTLIITEVNLDLLERQRVILNACRDHGFMSHEAWDALEGILNMLDYWSDERAEKKMKLESHKEAIKICQDNVRYAEAVVDELQKKLDNAVQDLADSRDGLEYELDQLKMHELIS